MDCKEHDFKTESGYSVCRNCGFSKRAIHYNNKNQEIISKLSENELEILKMLKKASYMKFPKNSQFYRMLKINYHAELNDKPLTPFQYLRLQLILGRLNINPNLKKNITREIESKKPKHITEIYNLLYTITSKQDLPITYTELKEVIDSFTDKKTFFKPLQMENLKQLSVRKYYWYISKTIEEKCDYMTKQEKMKFYRIVKNYYDLIRFKLSYGCNPTILINFLLYKSVNQLLDKRKLKNRLKVNSVKDLMTKAVFNNPQINKKKTSNSIFLQIKNEKLDKDFEYKIRFFKEN